MRNQEHNERRGGRGGHHHGHPMAGFGPAFSPGLPGPGFGPGPFPGGPGRPGRRGGRNRRGQVRESILALLAEQPRNGYQIMQELAERTQGMWRPSPGTVYPALSQMEDEGLIESFDNEGQRAFRLTEAGQASADQVEAPWEAVNAAFGGRDPEAMKTLWSEFGSLGGAVKELLRTATPDQLQAASTVVADARRRIYGLLASDPGTPNADDLR